MRLPAVFALAASLSCAGAPEPPLQLVGDGRYVMGTILEITLAARDPERARAVLDRCFERARRLDRLFSVYEETSDVSRLNRFAGRGPQPVAPEVAAILRDSIAYGRRTRGAFDVTVGPLVDLWGRAAELGRLPAEAELERARARVGFEKLRVHPDGRAELLGLGMQVDLGGVAKGWALDHLRALLRERGATSALLAFGQSSTWAMGAPPDAPGWRLLVRGPGGAFLGTITLRDRALSVSGALGQRVTIEGRELGHVLDPRSGRPLTRRRQAVVLTRDAALAEALSKALLVLDEAEALALLADCGECEGLLVDADGRRAQTPGFAEAAHFEPFAP